MKKELDKRWGDYQDGAMQVDQLKKQWQGKDLLTQKDLPKKKKVGKQSTLEISSKQPKPKRQPSKLGIPQSTNSMATIKKKRSRLNATAPGKNDNEDGEKQVVFEEDIGSIVRRLRCSSRDLGLVRRGKNQNQRVEGFFDSVRQEIDAQKQWEEDLQRLEDASQSDSADSFKSTDLYGDSDDDRDGDSNSSSNSGSNVSHRRKKKDSDLKVSVQERAQLRKSKNEFFKNVEKRFAKAHGFRGFNKERRRVGFAS